MTDKNLSPENSATEAQTVNKKEPDAEKMIRGAKNQRTQAKLDKAKDEFGAETPPWIISSDPSSQESKQKKRRFWRCSWFWCILVPLALCCVYFVFIASDRYVGEATVIVKQADSNAKVDLGISLLGTDTSSNDKDAQLVREFILSLDMLRKIDKALSLRNHYENKDADFLSRLWPFESQEDFLAYYRKHISVEYNELSGVVVIRAQAFTPEFAQQIVKAVLQFSEQYINQIGYQLATEQVNFVKNELDRAAEHLRKSKQQILEFQEEYQLFSPELESGAKLSMVNELEAEITRNKAALNNLSSYMNDTAADIVALKAKIASLEHQLLIERKKLVGGKSNDFSEVNARHADLQLDLEFATDLYKASLMSLEQARIEAYRKFKYLVVVDSPSLAEEAEYPRKLYNIVSFLVVLSLLYGAMKIIWATIKEHRDV